MTEALLVNPYDIPATAQALRRALSMPLAERRERHASLMSSIRRDDVHAWRRDFLRALTDLRKLELPEPIPA